jgi:hypothetical protein
LENTSTEPDIDVSLIRKVFVKATSIILFCITFFNFILQFFKYYIIRISLSITLIGDKAYPDTEGLKRLLTTD